MRHPGGCATKVDRAQLLDHYYAIFERSLRVLVIGTLQETRCVSLIRGNPTF
jgi:hypothetical protein